MRRALCVLGSRNATKSDCSNSHPDLTDDAHFYRADDIEKAASGIPKNISVLLSHTPEVYEQAAAVEFDLMLSGHTPVPRSEHKSVTVTPSTRIIDITDVLQSSLSLAHPGGREQPT